MDADTRARRLYRGLGFTDLLTGFTFPGTGAALRGHGRAAAAARARRAPAPLARPSRW